MSGPLICSPEAESPVRLIKRYEIDDRFTVAPIRAGADAVDIWCPIIPDTPYQRVLGIAVEAPGPWTVNHDADHGNLILHARLRCPLPADPAFQVRYAVERRPVTHMLDPACVRPLETPSLFLRSLGAEQFVDVNDTTRQLARRVIGGETNVLDQAHRIYDHVGGTMTYNAEKQSWKGSTEHALACSTGNCNDIHALFISLCRSVGIPARLLLGQAFEPPAPGQKPANSAGIIAGQSSSPQGSGGYRWTPRAPASTERVICLAIWR